MENLPHTNMAELLISLVCLAILVPVKEINIRYRKRLHTPIPVEILTVSQLISVWFTFDPFTAYSRDNGCFLTLLQVIIATGVAFASSLNTNYKIEIVGHIPAG